MSLDQLRALGARRRGVDHRLQRGRLHIAHRGVYAVGHPALAVRGRIAAAQLAIGAGAHLSHGWAAAMWGFWAWPVGPIDLTIAGRETRRRQRSGIRLHIVAALDERDVRRIDGISLTAPARTLLDIAEIAPRDLPRAFDSARLKRLVVAQDLSRAMGRRAGRRGRRAVRDLLDSTLATAPFTRSEAERRMLALIDAHAIVRPKVNARALEYEVDLLWPQERLIVEVDGYAHHGTRAAFERDRTRDAQLIASGYRVLRVSWRQIADEPELLASRLRRALRT